MKNIYVFGKYAAGLLLPLVFVFTCVSFNKVHAQYYASLEPATVSGNHNLIVGTYAVPVTDVYGMTATFSGDFSNNVVSSISINWSGSWLLVGEGTGAHSWDVNGNEDGADLTFWRTDEEEVTGYGKVMELVGTGYVGELLLDDIGKRHPGISVESITFLRKPQRLQVWPVPAVNSVSLGLETGENPSKLTVLNSAGKEMPVKITGNTLDISSYSPGIYFIQEVNSSGIRNGKLVVAHSGI